MRPLFNERTLAAERTRSRASMLEECSVPRQGAWVDTGGGSGHYTPAAPLEFVGRKAPLGDTPREQELAARMTNVVLERLAYPTDVELFVDDKVTISGTVYQVVGLLEPATFHIENQAVVRKGA